MAKTVRELVAEAKADIEEISIDDLKERIDKKEKLVFLDVREQDEYMKGHFKGAIFIPRGLLELMIERQIPDKRAKIICYCAGGIRSAFAAYTLKIMGYNDVVSLTEGFVGWAQAGYPYEK